MNDWTSYRLQNFIPLTEEVYFRLLERMGETFWPLQLLTLVLGGWALVLALTSRPRAACLLIAPVWVFVAVAFFMQRYGQLNWAGHYIAYAFFSQSFLLALISLLALDAPGATVLFAVLVVGVLGLVWKSVLAFLKHQTKEDKP